MKNSIYALGVLTLGLAGCGGGGGGDTSVDNAYTSSDNLAGTWVQSNVNYVTASGDVFKTRRQTIIVERDANMFTFTDCITGSALTAQVVGDDVQFLGGGALSLERIDRNTLQGQLVSGPYTTDVELVRVSVDETIELADVVFTSSRFIVSDWDQVCVETIVDNAAPDQVKIKATNDAQDVVVGINMTFSGDLSAGQYTYPSASNDVGGYITSPGFAANLFDPDGTIVVSENTTTDFTLTLTLDNSLDPGVLVAVGGVIGIEPSWFAY
ncbi:MAG: hypothetical protein GY938_16075 [Ketobacter sp.]|nr:hypothetical protein [Ketobacter sp.]